jgi:hypothetical protein
MEKRPDFFLTARGEIVGDLAISRACWTKERLKDEVRDDHMLIEIDPPIIGQAYGLGGSDIKYLVISCRYTNSTLFPVDEWPCHVYISRILDQNVLDTLKFSKEQIEIIAWGMISPFTKKVNS